MMDAARREEAAVSTLERSGHTAFIRNNTLFVWGGYQVRHLPEQVDSHTCTVFFNVFIYV